MKSDWFVLFLCVSKRDESALFYLFSPLVVSASMYSRTRKVNGVDTRVGLHDTLYMRKVKLFIACVCAYIVRVIAFLEDYSLLLLMDQFESIFTVHAMNCAVSRTCWYRGFPDYGAHGTLLLRFSAHTSVYICCGYPRICSKLRPGRGCASPHPTTRTCGLLVFFDTFVHPPVPPSRRPAFPPLLKQVHFASEYGDVFAIAFGKGGEGDGSGGGGASLPPP